MLYFIIVLSLIICFNMLFISHFFSFFSPITTQHLFQHFKLRKCFCLHTTNIIVIYYAWMPQSWSLLSNFINGDLFFKKFVEKIFFFSFSFISLNLFLFLPYKKRKYGKKSFVKIIHTFYLLFIIIYYYCLLFIIYLFISFLFYWLTSFYVLCIIYSIYQ